jgi:cytochrome c-type biogenesis protein CcmE
MNPKRKQRLFMTTFVLLATAGTVALVFLALEQNMNMFYPPADVVQGKVPANQTVRAGGMVLDGSVKRASDSLAVVFTLTDHQGAEFPVAYSGILPDLFREGQGILVEGTLNQNGVFEAVEVLAKHDENYMPPELMDMPGTKGPTTGVAEMPGLMTPEGNANGMSRLGTDL